METVFINSGDGKANESNRFRLPLASELNLKYSNKNMALVNLSVYYTW